MPALHLRPAAAADTRFRRRQNNAKRCLSTCIHIPPTFFSSSSCLVLDEKGGSIGIAITKRLPFQLPGGRGILPKRVLVG